MRPEVLDERNPPSRIAPGLVVTLCDRSTGRGDSIRLIAPRPLRGQSKLACALDVLALDVKGAVAVDVGAAVGGFTAALLDRGADCLYAVDAGFGQLVGRLRLDSRVINHERINVAAIDELASPIDAGGRRQQRSRR